MSDQMHAWGRVQEDGTVWVRLPGGGEHRVGQYAAGDPEAAVAFFRRKYEDTVAELALTADRLHKGVAAPDQAEAVVERVRGLLAEPPFVGDIAGLSTLLDQVHQAAAERRLTSQAEKSRARSEALAQREAIAEEAEQLADSTQWKATGDRFRALLEQWKTIPRMDKRTEQEIWERFRAARSQFDRARRAHFADLDKSREQAAQVKERLVAEAEQLAGSRDWGETTRAMRSLMDQWKEAPRASRDVDDMLWKRFRAAQDAFFQARNAVNAERDADQEQNLQAKQRLAEQAEALLPITDLDQAKAQLRGIQAQWEAIGFVPRRSKEAIESRLRRVERAISDAENEQWRKSDPVARERASATVSQFEKSIADLRAQLDKAVAAGNEARARSLQENLDSTKALLDAAKGVLNEYS